MDLPRQERDEAGDGGREVIDLMEVLRRSLSEGDDGKVGADGEGADAASLRSAG